MCSASCLDGRGPFLGQQVMEIAARLPSDMRFKNATLKYLPKIAAQEYCSEEFHSQPERGFAEPVGILMELIWQHYQGGASRALGGPGSPDRRHCRISM